MLHPWIERLRIFGAFGVVLIHCVGVGFMTLPVGGNQWMVFASIDALIRFALPLFFIISGALLLSKEPRPSFFSQKVYRILPAFLFWNLLFTTLVAWQTPLTVQELIQRLLHGEAYYHLWFLWALFPLYLLSPFLYQGLKRASPFVTFLSLSLFGALCSYIEGWAIFHEIPLHPLFKGIIYLGYFVVGGILFQRPLSLRSSLLLGVMGLCGVLGETLLSSSLTEALCAIRFSSPFVALMSVSVFTLFFHRLNTPLTRTEQTLAPLTFGIYLIHPLLLATVISPLTTFGGIIFFSIITFIGSAILVKGLQNTPLRAFV